MTMKLKAILGVAVEKLQVGENIGYNNLTTPKTNDNVRIRALGDGSDVDNNDNTQGTVNDTDSELSSLSHVDAPNDVIYMVGGVVIAMILVGLVIVIVAVTINKLRKREETSSASPATNIEAQTTTFATTPNHHRNSTSSQCSNNSQHQQIFSTSSSTTSFEANHNQNNANLNNSIYNNNNNNIQSTITSNGNCNATTVTIVRQSPPSNGWVFPPKAPTPNIYNCSSNFDAIGTPNDKQGFKGFRKQFSGRFKRLVAKKPQEPVPVIPPELKPQLKTIYVY